MEDKKYIKRTTSEKQAFAKQFSEKEKASYNAGKMAAYRHASSMAGKELNYLNQYKDVKK